MDTTLFEALKPQLRGDLLLPGDPGYEEARTVWNGMIDRTPPAVVRCLGIGDVVACVNFARTNSVPLSIKGGGHNIAGLAVGSDALLLDMSRMRGVWVDPERRIAHAQPGCLLGDVDRETQLHGLAPVLGFVSLTGIAGLTLGGGFGYLSRRYGWTCDNVRSVTLVTADGRIVRASREENSDLFWAVLGGGGNFGVAVDFEYDLFPVGPEIYGGAIAWSSDQIPAVLSMYRDLVNSAPPELTCALALRLAPPAPWISPECHGKLVIMLVACHSGSVEEGERLLVPVKTFGTPAGDVIMRRPYTTQQSLLDATQPKGRRYYWKSEYTAKVDDALLDTLIKHTGTLPSPHSALIVFPIDGALNELAEDYSAVGNRDARFIINVTSSWDSPDDDAVNIAWTRQAWDDVRPFSTGGTYINFLTEEDGEDRIGAAYGNNHARLAQVKARWDPENFFSANKNIPPASA